MTKINSSTIEGLKQGDHSAFEKIFSLYYINIKTFVFGYVKSMADAEEIAEDIFVELWQNHQKIISERSFDAYLYTIAKNKAINLLKRKHLSYSFTNSQPDKKLAYSPEDEYIAQEKALLIEMIVEKMPPQRRTIYHLRNHGLSNEEIAKELKTTKRNVESQISLALKTIRQGIFVYFFLF